MRAVSEQWRLHLGLTPTELVKNFAVVHIVIFSTQVLGVFDTILVAPSRAPIPGDTDPRSSRFQMQDLDIDAGLWAPWMPPKKAMRPIILKLWLPPLFAKDFCIHRRAVPFGCWPLLSILFGFFLAERFFLLRNYAGLFPFDYKLGRFLVKVPVVGLPLFQTLGRGLYSWYLPFSW